MGDAAARNEERLNRAFESSDAVVLFFSVNESGAFQGCAHGEQNREAGEAEAAEAPPWTNLDGSPTSWGSVFQVKWQTIYDCARL